MNGRVLTGVVAGSLLLGLQWIWSANQGWGGASNRRGTSSAQAIAESPAVLAQNDAPPVLQEIVGKGDAGASTNDPLVLPARYTNTLVLKPAPDSDRVASLVSRLLPLTHYSRHPLDDTLSEKVYARYLEVLDPGKYFFLASDIEEFSKFKRRLDDYTEKGNIQPAYDVFNRYLHRYDQQYAYVMELLRTEKFEFNSDEKYTVNRKDEKWATNLEEAKELWRKRLRFEYLTEKLNQPEPKRMYGLLWKRVTSKDPAAVDKELVDFLGRTTAPEWIEYTTNAVAGVEGGGWALKGLNGGGLTPLALKEGDTNPPPALVERFETRRLEKQSSEIVKKLIRRYNRTMRILKQYDSGDVLQLYLDSLAHAYDPHSNYFGKSESDNFAINMNLTLFGIGATLTTEDGYTVIRDIKPGSPAQKSKQLHPNDRIVAVAQGDKEPVDVVEEKLNKVVEQIRGPKGTEVRLTIIPHDAPDTSVRKVVKIIRDEIKLEEGEAKARLIEHPDPVTGRIARLGVIDLPSFYTPFPGIGGQRGSTNSTTRDVARLITKLKAEKVEGILLDLRRNGGGSLEESVNLAGLFIKSGPVVQVRDFNGRRGIDEDEDPAMLWDGPLLVLTSRFSASASEIVAGALQDYGRALIVGDVSTHGKGTVQNLTDLSNYTRAWGLKTIPGSLKVTIRKFYRASGESTQLRGIVPDIVLPSLNNYADVGEASLTNALPWDTIASAPYEPLNWVAPHLPELQRRVKERIGKDTDFTYLGEDIERFRKQKAEGAVSMNESVRVREKKEALERSEKRKAEIAARNETLPKTYEITLKNCDLPGLPEPIGQKKNVAASGDKRSSETGAAKNETTTKPIVQAGVGAAAGETAKSPSGEGDPSSPKTDAEDDDEAKGPEGVAADINMREAQRILLDLIHISGGRGTPTAKTPTL